MRNKTTWRITAAGFVLVSALCGASCSATGAGKDNAASGAAAAPAAPSSTAVVSEWKPSTEREQFLYGLSLAAIEQTRHAVVYDPAYVTLDYPGGDVPADRGVCADVLVRAYRTAARIDLQVDVHQDMKANFKKYPTRWGLKKPDKNIDHRRVLNLMTLFSRKGETLPITASAADYRPGDIVSWDLNGKGLTHIGIVTHVRSRDGQRFQIVHNIGAGPQLEDVLFDWKIIGHHRYYGGRKLSDKPLPRP